MNMPALSQAIREFEDMADPELAAAARAAVAAGTLTWTCDPQVEGAYGLVRPGTNRAVVVVYAPGFLGHGDHWDFEDSGEL